MNIPPEPPRRVIAYVDGFNLYFGMRESGWQRYYWLNIQRLASLICPRETTLIEVKYFTSRILLPPAKQRRQNTYLEALEAATSCQIIYGNYNIESLHCDFCDTESLVPKEKMTDVNIAVEMMKDAFQDRFDVATLISGDSDLTPPVMAIRQLFPDKSVVVCFPPNRTAKELKQKASGTYNITRVNLRDSQLPDEVTKPNGFILRRPIKWAKASEGGA